MRVRVLYFGSIRTVAKQSRETVEIKDGVSLATLVRELEKRHTRISNQEFALAVNAKHVNRASVKLRDGDEVALIPPISGG